MTEPSPSRPVPGPPGPGPSGPPDQPRTTDRSASTPPAAAGAGSTPGGYAERTYADLEERPVAEHVVVFEAEHARLQHELSTIDRL